MKKKNERYFRRSFLLAPNTERVQNCTLERYQAYDGSVYCVDFHSLYVSAFFHPGKGSGLDSGYFILRCMYSYVFTTVEILKQHKTKPRQLLVRAHESLLIK